MLDRDFAAKARSLVEAQIESTSEHEKERAYRSSCESLPALLRSAGLLRTVLFTKAKDEIVYQHLQVQLQNAGVYSNREDRTLDLAAWVTQSSLSVPEYRHVSNLALRVALWHKRLAQALLRKKEERDKK